MANTTTAELTHQRIIRNFTHKLLEAISGPCLFGVVEELFIRNIITFNLKDELINGRESKLEKAKNLMNQLYYIPNKEEFLLLCDGLQAGDKTLEGTLEGIAQSMRDQFNEEYIGSSYKVISSENEILAKPSLVASSEVAQNDETVVSKATKFRESEILPSKNDKTLTVLLTYYFMNRGIPFDVNAIIRILRQAFGPAGYSTFNVYNIINSSVQSFGGNILTANVMTNNTMPYEEYSDMCRHINSILTTYGGPSITVLPIAGAGFLLN